MYDEKHRFEVKSTEPNEQNRLLQKGIREKLLCGDCETKLSKWEGYASKLLNGGIDFVSIHKGNLLHLSGIDYSAFRLFQLSVLWRASISNNGFFSNISLGNHEEKIRTLIISSNPGLTWQYGCVLFGLVDNKSILTDLMIKPIRFRFQGHIAYRFIFGGFMWIYFASKHKPTTPNQPAFLNETGEMTILLKNIASVKDIEDSAVKLYQAGKL
jgi:hypothetical protein